MVVFIINAIIQYTCLIMNYAVSNTFESHYAYIAIYKFSCSYV